MVVVAVPLQTATQVYAYLYSYHSELGLNFHGVYPPWAFVEWMSRWGYEPGAAGAAIILEAVTLLVFAAVKSGRAERANKYTHGSAMWASRADLRACGLLPNSKRRARLGGVYVGAIRDKLGRVNYLRHAGPEHVLTVAPTRSGKTLCVYMTLLSHLESVLVLDLKGELAQMTSGWRSRYARNRVLIYEPAHPGSVGWNPLDEIDIDSPNAIASAQNLTTMLVDPDGKGLRNHWTMTAQILLTGLVLFVLHKARTGRMVASLSTIDAELSNPERNIHDLWTEMASMASVSPVIASAGNAMLADEIRAAAEQNARWAAKDMLDRPDEEAGSVLSTAKSCLSLYRDPIVARNTDRSDFKIADLMNHDSAMTLYVVTQPDDKLRLRPLVRLFLNMAIKKLAPRMEYAPATTSRKRWWRGRQHTTSARARAKYKHPLLMELDEFLSLGKMPEFQDALSWIAGYGIKVRVSRDRDRSFRRMAIGRFAAWRSAVSGITIAGFGHRDHPFRRMAIARFGDHDRCRGRRSAASGRLVAPRATGAPRRALKAR